MESCRQYGIVTTIEPDFSCYLRGHIHPQNTHEMPSHWTLQKVRKFRKLILALFYIGLLAFPASALPLDQPQTTIKERNGKITVQTKGCKPLTTEELRARLGSVSEGASMAYGDEDMKRSMSPQSVINEGAVDDLSEQYNDDETIDEISDSEKGTISVRNKYFMRRKRDATLTSYDDDDNENSNNPSNGQFLYQNLLYDTIRSKSRQKRSYRRVAKSRPPWECEKINIFRNLNDSFFPRKILDGKCTQKSCFFGMYTCNPVRYAIKVLQRDPADACRPVPLIGKNTTYEESWIFTRHHVVVACECEYSRNRSKRKRNRSRHKS